MSKSMKPRRLCGSRGQIVLKRKRPCAPEFNTYSVICSFCGAEGGTYFSAHEAIHYWNEINGLVRRCA